MIRNRIHNLVYSETMTATRFRVRTPLFDIATEFSVRIVEKIQIEVMGAITPSTKIDILQTIRPNAEQSDEYGI